MFAAIKYSSAIYYKAHHPMLVKSSYVLGSTLVGFVGGEVLNLNAILSGVAGLVGSIILAFIVRQPAARAARSAEETSTIDNLIKTHAEDTKSWQQRLDYSAKLERIIRVRAHKALGEVQRLEIYAKKLQVILRKERIEMPDFNFRTYDDIVGEFDRQIMNLETSYESRNDDKS